MTPSCFRVLATADGLRKQETFPDRHGSQPAFEAPGSFPVGTARGVSRDRARNPAPVEAVRFSISEEAASRQDKGATGWSRRVKRGPSGLLSNLDGAARPEGPRYA
jgi:hypothetical protein